MIRLLILDDDAARASNVRFYEQLIRRLKGEQTPRFVVKRVECVQQARQLVANMIEPFDIFVISLRLEHKVGKHARDFDGVEVMKELLKMSPRSDAIITTRDMNANTALRAYLAGAKRFFCTLFPVDELLFTLRSLYEKRRTEEERQWLKILNEIAEQTQLSRSVSEVAEVVVRGTLRLGFERARLWLVSHNKERLIGINQAGTEGLADFSQLRVPIEESVYAQHILGSREPVFFHAQQLADGYLYRQYAAQGFKSPVGEWVSIPLWSRDHCLGHLTFDNADRAIHLRPAQRDFLRLFGKQVAAVIERAQLQEQEARKKRELEVINRACQILMMLAEEQEESVWHATLTVATADYALRFNRAAFFLAEQEGSRLRGRMGVGHFNKEDAERDWREDEKKGLNLDNYLHLLRTGALKPTPIDEAIRDLVIEVGEVGENNKSVFSDVLRTGQGVIIKGAQKADALPTTFLKRFDGSLMNDVACAVLPLQGAAGKPIGLLVLDHAFSKQPIRHSTLKHLEPLLNQAALTVETMRQRAIREALLDANYAIMAKVSQQPLGDTLTQICHAAQAVMGADMVMIYPLKPHIEPYAYDFENIGQIGRQSTHSLPKMMGKSGTASYILRSGSLVVSDVIGHQSCYDGQTLSQHPLVQQEQIKSFIGLAIKDSRTGATLGVQFFDYRKKRTLTEHDLHLAGLFANLAAVAIQNVYNDQQVRQEMEQAESRGQASERELKILRRVLEEALGDTDEEKLIKTLFNAAHDLLHTSQMRLILVLRQWVKPENRLQAPREVRYHYLLNPDGGLYKGTEEDIYRGITGLTLKTGQSHLVANVDDQYWRHIFYNWVTGNNTQSELDVPIKLGDKVIGVFNAESPLLGAFTPAHQATFERLAAVAALALNNLRRKEHLHTVLKAAKAVTAHFGLQETLDKVIQAARQAAPDLSVLTIWYRDPEDNRLILGPHFGVYHAQQMQGEEQREGSMVWKVMHSPEPIWVPVAREETRLRGRFVQNEQIVSTAAFPLRANNEKVGAMFFSYRQNHEFTSEEKALFPILAEIVADCVRDAAQLEATRKERDRLDAARAITHAVGATLDLDETLTQVMSVLRDRLFPDTNICVSTYNQAEQLLEFTAVSKQFYQIDNPQEEPSFQVPLKRGCIACQVVNASLRTEQIEIINAPNVKDEPTYLRLIHSTQSEIGISLLSTNSSNQRVLGVLVLESPKANRFDKEDEALLRLVSQKISLAMDRAYQSAELQFQTTIAATTSWAAEIAHDIRNEVGLIRNWTYWLKEDEQLSEEQRIYINNIEDSAKQLAWTGKSAGALRARPLKELLIDTWLEQTVRSLISDKNHCVGLKFELECTKIKICAVESALRNAVRHLVRNALEAMQKPESGDLIIRSKALDNEQMIEVQIEDSGPGLDDTIRQSLFQIPKSTKNQKDRGFGLLFTRYAIQELGGHVRCIAPKVLSGTCFTFTLPIASPHRLETSYDK